MKVTFKDEVLLELYETGKTKDKRYKTINRINIYYRDM